MPAQKRQHNTDPHLLTSLVCPVTGGPLSVSKAGGELFSKAAKLAYPIRDGIPIMIESEAREMTEKELAG